ncbi:hypothetical protein, partial [Aeromonas allosaccharophila]
STQPPSRVKPYFQRLFEVIDLAFCVAACPVDGAHYRELNLSGKQIIAKRWLSSLVSSQSHQHAY